MPPDEAPSGPAPAGPSSDATPPLKRHAALQPLSREHMGGLIQARNLQRAAELGQTDRTRAVAEFVAVWRAEIREHFDDEERLLLPLTRSEELRRRLLAEHGELRQLARKCENDPRTTASDPAMLRRLGTLLHDHIRWEERDFFEAVQRDHPEALAELVSEAGHIEARRPGSRARMSLTEECRAVPSTPAPHHMKEATMSDDRLRQAPAERFATDHLVFDLHAEIAALRAEPSSPRHGHRQKTLYKHAGRTVALFVMDAGAVLPEHAAGGTVTVQTIEGTIDMTASGETCTLPAGTMLAMAPGVRHDVRATVAAAFLLQVSLADHSVKA
ncbi:MAG: hemerythrin domain-containing protein [Phycisphaerales bacterium]